MRRDLCHVRSYYRHFNPLAFRHSLWDQGLGLAEAMDTALAQRPELELNKTQKDINLMPYRIVKADNNDAS